MKYIKNIKLLIITGLVLRGDLIFADRYAEEGAAMMDAFKSFEIESDSKLIKAAEEGNLKDLESALNDPATNINETGKKSHITALMYAARNGRIDMVRLLLARGANPHVRAAWGDNTALREAVRNDHKEIVKLLVSKPTDINSKNSMGYALIEAAKKGDKGTVELLLANGADPNSAGSLDYNDSFPTTVLIEASRKGSKDIVKLLIDNGMDFKNEKTNPSGSTALSVAASEGHVEIAKLLLAGGALVDSRNVWRQTALMIAAHKGYTAIVKDLIVAGADINDKDDGGITAFEWANKGGHTKTAKFIDDFIKKRKN